MSMVFIQGRYIPPLPQEMFVDDVTFHNEIVKMVEENDEKKRWVFIDRNIAIFPNDWFYGLFREDQIQLVESHKYYSELPEGAVRLTLTFKGNDGITYKY